MSGDKYRSNRRFLYNFREVLKLRGFFCRPASDLKRLWNQCPVNQVSVSIANGSEPVIDKPAHYRSRY
jgi:hypothetical protein